MTRETTQLVRSAPEVKNIERPLPATNSLASGYLYDAAPESEHITYLRDFINSVRKHLWLVLGVVLCATAASVVYNSRIPDVYEAQAQVRVDREKNLGGREGMVIVSTESSMDPQYFNTQLQVLTSPALMRRVVKGLDLENDKSFFRSPNDGRTITQSVLQMFGFNKAAPKPNSAPGTTAAVAPVITKADKSAGESDKTVLGQQEIEDELVQAQRLNPFVRSLIGSLKVSQVRDTRLIAIKFQHHDPSTAAKVVNIIADIYVRSNTEKKTDFGQKEAEFINQRVAQLQGEIRTAFQKQSEYAKKTGLLQLDKGQDVVVARLSALNNELIDAENHLKVAAAQYNIGNNKEVVEATTAKETHALEENLAQLEREKAKMLEIYTEKWPKVMQLQVEIDALRKHIAEVKTRRTSEARVLLESRYREAVQREQDARRAFNEQKAAARVQNDLAVDYEITQQEIATKQKLLDAMLEQQKKQEMTRQGASNNISVQDWALPPPGPVSPRRSQSIMMAFIMSLAFGVGLARLLDYLDTTVRTVQDIEKYLRIPVLALIPSVGGWRKLAPSTALQKADGSGGPGELLIHTDIRSPLAETYRQLRTSILLSTAGRTPKTLLVTSSQASEGKTTNAINVAHTLTQTGAKVLIIDADMRRPRLHSVFQVDNAQGLSTVLASDMSEAEILDVIVQYEETGIYVLPSGPLPPNPSELLSSEPMRRLLNILGDIFTHVVIDSPPITLVTDSVILGSMMDGVLLVVQGDRTSREMVRRSQRLLHEVGARIFGVILNNVNVKPEDYYYYQSYYGSRYYTDNAKIQSNGNGSNGNNANGNGKG